jgi:hypothetical protein
MVAVPMEDGTNNANEQDRDLDAYTDTRTIGRSLIRWVSHSSSRSLIRSGRCAFQSIAFIHVCPE